MNIAQTEKLRKRMSGLLPVMSAYESGELIESRHDENMVWKDNPNPSWTSGVEYRVKPKPQLRPYTYEEMNELVGTVVVNKVSARRAIIQSAAAGLGTTAYVTLSNDMNRSGNELIEYYTFVDGSPCGAVV